MQKKKSLGQHFLRNPYYLGLVADAVGIKKGETVVEIGPGEGTLTAALLERGAKVIALEKDHRLIALLQHKFAGKDFEVIEGDALDYQPPKHYKLAGNIPYYISGALFKKFLSEKLQPSTLVFLVQKEVAKRIVHAKKESVLSLSVKVYGEPRYVKSVSRGAFSPAPRVDSAILAIEHISRKNFKNAAHERAFFELIKKGFSSKRKYLLNNIGHAHAHLLQKVGVPAKARAEDISLTEWLQLAQLHKN